MTTKETESEFSIETYEVKTKASNSLEKFINLLRESSLESGEGKNNDFNKREKQLS